MAPTDVGWTTKKVRGKRHGTRAEKWHTGKLRHAGLRQRPVVVENVSVHPSDVAKPKARKRRRTAQEDKSPLELLPAEVVQQIFEYSANLDLPLVSTRLALKLSNSQHLQSQLTSHLLNPILGDEHGTSTAFDIARANRALDSRFMTWQFFASWLQSYVGASVSDDMSDDSNAQRWIEMWSRLHPSPSLLPPRKLLSPPFTSDKAQFLAVLARDLHDVAATDPAYGELAHEGLTAAIKSCQAEFVSLFLRMGVNVTTEVLRVAVADAGCDEHIVRSLVDHCRPAQVSHDASIAGTASKDPAETVDLLDPTLWACAEKMQSEGNEKGTWLLCLLRDAG